MTEHERESDLRRQRRANFDELVRLGIDPYPRKFERTDTIADLVSAHGQKPKEDLEAAAIQTRTAGRIVAIRSFGKANFLESRSEAKNRWRGCHCFGIVPSDLWLGLGIIACAVMRSKFRRYF